MRHQFTGKLIVVAAVLWLSASSVGFAAAVGPVYVPQTTTPTGVPPSTSGPVPAGQRNNKFFFGGTSTGIGLGHGTVYNNSTNDLAIQFNPGTAQVGPEILLAGTQWYVTQFSFEYWGQSSNPNFFVGGTNVQARVEFYRNDGALFNGYASPGSVLYDSGWFVVPGPTPRSIFVFGAGDFGPAGVDISGITNMTWTVQFRGLGAGDSLGVDLYSPPTVGGGYGDLWQKNGTSWSLTTNSLVHGPAVFAADIIATSNPLLVDIGLRMFDGTNKVGIVCEAPGTNGTLTSSLRIAKNGTNYRIVLVETKSPFASEIHVKTSAGIKAWERLAY